MKNSHLKLFYPEKEKIKNENNYNVKIIHRTIHVIRDGFNRQISPTNKKNSNFNLASE